MAGLARLPHAGRDRAPLRGHGDHRARRGSDQARAADTGVRTGTRGGGRAWRPVRQRDLRRPRPEPAVRRVRAARRGGDAVRHSPRGRVHGLPECPHAGGRGGDHRAIRWWRHPGGRAARPAVRREADGSARGGPRPADLRAAVRRAACGTSRCGSRGPRRAAAAPRRRVAAARPARRATRRHSCRGRGATGGFRCRPGGVRGTGPAGTGFGSFSGVSGI